MKKLLLLIVFLLASAGSTYFFLQDGQVAKAPLKTLFSKDTQDIVAQSQSFMEDIQYKDFKSAAQYSLPEQRDKLDMPRLIERLFHIKPELLDINQLEVTHTDIDSTGKRARVYLQAEVKLLNTQNVKTPEIILYFKKVDEKWYMDFASSIK